MRALLVAALLLTPGLAPLGPQPDAGDPQAGADDPLSEVTIVRDAKGVPHVYGPTDRAVFYANGYVQARDRLFAMDVIRHVAYGTSAAVLGPGQLPSDLAARRDLASRTSVATQLLNGSDELRQGARAYAAGVNHAVAEMEATGELPAEFPLLNHAPEPWTPIDTAQVAVFLLDRFGAGGGSELDNAELLDDLEGRLPAERAETAFDDLVRTTTDDSYATVPPEEGVYTGPAVQPKDLDVLPADQAGLLDPAARAEPFGVGDTRLPPSGDRAEPVLDASKLRWGSNALVVSPKLSASGKAMVGGGPQTGYFNPQVLYEVGLHGDEVDVTGVGVIGAMGVVIGRTQSFAWTVTSGISDQTDVVGLEAAGPRSYRWDGEVRRLDCREEIHVAVQPPALALTGEPQAPRVVEQEVCRTGFGPVVGVTRDSGGDPTHFWAQRKSWWGLDLQGAGLWLGIDRTSNLQEFQAQFEGFPFTFNFHYAGPEGACYFHVGAHPVRDTRLDPRFPTPAGDAWTWSDVQTGDDLPRDCNPGQGYYANWNNLPQRGWTAGDTRELWRSVHRVERLDAEVGQRLAELNATDPSPRGDERLTLADVQAILERAATEDSLAGEIVPTLLSDRFDQATPAAAGQALEDWLAADTPWRSGLNGTAPSAASVSNTTGEVYVDPGHTVYDRLLPALLEEVLGDELGDHVREVDFTPTAGEASSDPHAADHGRHRNKFAILVDALEGRTDHGWCDDETTSATEDCADQVADAYAAANLTGFASTGEIPLTPKHRSPFTAIGAGPEYRIPMTNRATYYHFHVGPDTSTSVSAIPPGQVGTITLDQLAQGRTPKHMDDQLRMYADFDFKPVPFSLAQAQASAESERTLVVPDP